MAESDVDLLMRSDVWTGGDEILVLESQEPFPPDQLKDAALHKGELHYNSVPTAAAMEGGGARFPWMHFFWNIAWLKGQILGIKP